MMADVWFYHLDRKTVDAELPGLLLRGLERGLRMAVVTVSAERVKELSQNLWGLEDVAFIPHGFKGEPNPEQQPIYLCTDDEPVNNADYVFYIDGSAPITLNTERRASIMFNGQDEVAVEQARRLWRRFKAENATIRYWKQDENGRWKDQAAVAS
jgi:DNA polymerase III subunit chi